MYTTLTVVLALSPECYCVPYLRIVFLTPLSTLSNEHRIRLRVFQNSRFLREKSLILKLGMSPLYTGVGPEHPSRDSGWLLAGPRA